MFRIEIHTGNAAFEEDKFFELGRIMDDVFRDIDVDYGGDQSGSCIDINGNKVGEWSLTND